MKIRIALFFDGTCNNKHESTNKMTNVGKLFDAHQGSDIAILNQAISLPTKDIKPVFKLYIRGVGTKKYSQDLDNLDDDFYENIVFGSAFGAGGHDRIRYAVDSICQLVKSIERESTQPVNDFVSSIEWDLFGFSRGAALARHFVNVIFKSLWAANCKTAKVSMIQKMAQINHHTRFLGLYDTVGSFGIPGNDIDPFTFDVDNSKADHIYHLCAEDELRENFDLHSVYSKKFKGNKQVIPDEDVDRELQTYCSDLEDVEQTKAQFKDKPKWCIEESYPGVHGDIGGGYGSVFEQGLDNNLLSRIYLRKMHVISRAVGVDFEPIEQCQARYPDAWRLEDNVKQSFTRLINQYHSNPILKTKHLIFRCHQRYRVVADYDFKRKNFRFSNYGRIRKKFLRDFDKYRIELVKSLLIADCFDRLTDAEAFFLQYDEFRLNYIHTSHFPANGLPGMDAQKAPIDFNEWPAKQLRSQRYYMNLDFQLQRRIYWQE
jgi:hypothetical protein